MGEHEQAEARAPASRRRGGAQARRRESGPVPTPGHIGNLPDDAPGPGKPIAYPPHEPRD